MTLQMELKKKLVTKTDRVKFVDFHPTEPWVLSAIYNGNVTVHDYTTQCKIKDIEVSSLPTRCAKFIPRKSWIVTGGDDLHIRVYNYNTLAKVKAFEAHSDYIRYLAVHPTLPYLLSSSDDMTIVLWNWNENWLKVTSFEGHAHYVMMCVWNPKDSHIFASASLDRTIKVWGIKTFESSTPCEAVSSAHFTLVGHERGVNSVDYSPNNDKPYIVSASDDKTVRIWDYQTRQCIQILSDHTKNVSCAIFHLSLPLIISGSEDGTLKFWHSGMYRLEKSIDNNMQRIWSINVLKSSNSVAVAYDEGTVVCTLGSDSPVASMKNGKIIIVKNNEIQSANLKLLDTSTIVNGERITIPIKDLETLDIFPQEISHHPNGRFIVVCGDGEYIIYTSQALRNKSYGKSVDFVWSTDGNYAIRPLYPQNKIILYSNFTEYFSFLPSFTVTRLFGGPLLGLKSQEFICFYDWQDCRFIRKIDAIVNDVFWSDSCDFIAITCDDSAFILQYDKNAVIAAKMTNIAQNDVGIPIAFELQNEINSRIYSGFWICDTFIFVTQEMKLQMYSSGFLDTIAYLDRVMYILGYIVEQNRLYLIDKDSSIVSYEVHYDLFLYMRETAQNNHSQAAEYFQNIPKALHKTLSKFVSFLGFKDVAIDLTYDEFDKFDLCLAVNRLDSCEEILDNIESKLSSEESFYEDSGTLVSNVSDIKLINPKKKKKPDKIRESWKRLGDASLLNGNFDLARKAFMESSDLSSLLLLYTSLGYEDGLRWVADKALESNMINLSFTAYFLLQDVVKCIESLIKAKKYSEAALFSRTYCPSRVKDVLPLWNSDLSQNNNKLQVVMLDVSEDPDLSKDFDLSLQGEEAIRKKVSHALYKSVDYSHVKSILGINLVEEIKNIGLSGVENALEEMLHNTQNKGTIKVSADDDGRDSSDVDSLEFSGTDGKRESNDFSSKIDYIPELELENVNQNMSENDFDSDY